ncbi:uncharacterized protein LOC135922334 isoform X2 [Gordionus sp. m RMFG-2023]|uniref:uncharacterized protein LOC135922334 isoform X2 n=1 Tax=Gordionus sp. m RMFG-2023 TaxID=3053472 RepID=UPI0031FE36EE
MNFFILILATITLISSFLILIEGVQSYFGLRDPSKTVSCSSLSPFPSNDLSLNSFNHHLAINCDANTTLRYDNFTNFGDDAIYNGFENSNFVEIRLIDLNISKVSEDFINALPSLKILNLSRNNIPYFFSTQVINNLGNNVDLVTRYDDNRNASNDGVKRELKILDLSYNYLKQIDVQKLIGIFPDLEVLDVSHNYLERLNGDLQQYVNENDFDATRLVPIKVLAHHNSFQSLSGSLFTNYTLRRMIISLNLSANQISYIDNKFWRQILVKDLDLSQNRLTNLHSLQKLIGLGRLVLDHNTNLELSGLYEGSSLNISNKTSLTPSLEILSLSNVTNDRSQSRRSPPALSFPKPYFSYLKFLDLSYNFLRASAFSPLTFSNLTHLTHLSLKGLKWIGWNTSTLVGSYKNNYERLLEALRGLPEAYDSSEPRWIDVSDIGFVKEVCDNSEQTDNDGKDDISVFHRYVFGNWLRGPARNGTLLVLPLTPSNPINLEAKKTSSDVPIIPVNSNTTSSLLIFYNKFRQQFRTLGTKMRHLLNVEPGNTVAGQSIFSDCPTSNSRLKKKLYPDDEIIARLLLDDYFENNQLYNYSKRRVNAREMFKKANIEEAQPNQPRVLIKITVGQEVQIECPVHQNSIEAYWREIKYVDSPLIKWSGPIQVKPPVSSPSFFDLKPPRHNWNDVLMRTQNGDKKNHEEPDISEIFLNVFWFKDGTFLTKGRVRMRRIIDIFDLGVRGNENQIDGSNFRINHLRRADIGLYSCYLAGIKNSRTFFKKGADFVIFLGDDFFVQVWRSSIVLAFGASLIFLCASVIIVYTVKLVRACQCIRRRAQDRKFGELIRLLQQQTYREVENLRTYYMNQLKTLRDSCLNTLEYISVGQNISSPSPEDFPTLKTNESKCYTQQQNVMERWREQVKDRCGTYIKGVGSLKETYLTSQVHRLREYTSLQIEKMIESYSNQVDKLNGFTYMQMEKLREQYKIKAKSIAEMIEMMNLDNCRHSFDPPNPTCHDIYPNSNDDSYDTTPPNDSMPCCSTQVTFLLPEPKIMNPKTPADPFFYQSRLVIRAIWDRAMQILEAIDIDRLKLFEYPGSEPGVIEASLSFTLDHNNIRDRDKANHIFMTRNSIFYSEDKITKQLSDKVSESVSDKNGSINSSLDRIASKIVSVEINGDKNFDMKGEFINGISKQILSNNHKSPIELKNNSYRQINQLNGSEPPNTYSNLTSGDEKSTPGIKNSLESEIILNINNAEFNCKNIPFKINNTPRVSTSLYKYNDNLYGSHQNKKLRISPMETNYNYDNQRVNTNSTGHKIKCEYAPLAKLESDSDTD